MFWCLHFIVCVCFCHYLFIFYFIFICQLFIYLFYSYFIIVYPFYCCVIIVYLFYCYLFLFIYLFIIYYFYFSSLGWHFETPLAPSRGSPSGRRECQRVPTALVVIAARAVIIRWHSRPIIIMTVFSSLSSSASFACPFLVLSLLFVFFPP